MSISHDPKLLGLLMDALQLFQRGQTADAGRICERILRADPRVADALHLSALIAQKEGQAELALRLIDRAIGLSPSEETMHANRAVILEELGRDADALQAAEQAIRIAPNLMSVHLQKGKLLTKMRRWQDAEHAYVLALQREPRNARVLNGLGWLHLKQGRFDAARDPLVRACELDPQLGVAHSNLGAVCWYLRRHDEAMNAYKRAVELSPHDAYVWDQWGAALLESGSTGEAKAAFAKAFDLEPSAARLLKKCLSLSYVHASTEAMLDERRQFERELDGLLDTKLRIESPGPQDYLSSIFSLAYQGHDVLPTMRKLAQLYLHLCPGLAWRAPHLDQPRAKGQRIRVAFYSAYVHDHPVAHCYAPLVKALADDPALDVYLISNCDLPSSGAGRRPYDGFAGTFVKVTDQVFRAREEIAGLTPDVLFFQDIGMESLSYFLGFSRLAHAQIVMGGHPVTTGLPEIDQYLSSVWSEPEEAQAHYSEKLIRLDPGTALFERPAAIPSIDKDREALGLPASGAVYLCPMMLQKIHPEFDAAVAAILEADPEGRVVFFKHAHLPLHLHLRSRFERSIPDALLKRVIFLPWIQNKEDFMSVNAQASVVLDPFHFGIGSTAIITTAVGTPVVTWPGRFLRGRVGLTFSRLLDLDELVAPTQEGYSALAVKVANDPVLRARVVAKIRANEARFFDSTEYLSSIKSHIFSFAP